jgi:hypothetical protein
MAGSKKDSFENSLLLLIFNNTTITGIGSDGLRGSTTAGSLYVALYSGAPSDSAAGTEITYTGYARVAVARSGAGWTVATNNASNAAAITFGPCTSGTPTATHFAVCKAGTRDVDDAIYWGDLTSSLAISPGITPEFAIGDLDVNED